MDKIKKEQVITIRCTEQQKQDIMQSAAEQGLSLSTYILILYKKFNNKF